MDRIDKGLVAINADPAKSEAMREALKMSKNVPADSMNYAEFGELPLDLFKDVCMLREQDWMLFNECSEEEQQKEPVYILNHNAFCDKFDKRVKTPSRLTYTLYKSMRKLQNVKEEFPVKEGLSEEDMIKLLKERGYKVVKDDVPAAVSEPMEEVYEVIKSLDKTWIFFYLSEKVKDWCEDLKQSAIEYSNDQARCALCGVGLSKKTAYVEGRSFYKGTKFLCALDKTGVSDPEHPWISDLDVDTGKDVEILALAEHLKSKNNDAK